MSYMRNMHALRPKFLRQALAEGPEPELASRKCAGGLVPTYRGSRASEHKRALFAELIIGLFLEREDGFAREAKRCDNVRLKAILDLLLLYLEEGLPVARRSVEDTDTNR
jgi:hypothetical protein